MKSAYNVFIAQGLKKVEIHQNYASQYAMFFYRCNIFESRSAFGSRVWIVRCVCILRIHMSCAHIVCECLSALVEHGLNNTVHIPLTTALPFSDGYFGRKKLKAQDLLSDELAPTAAHNVTTYHLIPFENVCWQQYIGNKHKSMFNCFHILEHTQVLVTF